MLANELKNEELSNSEKSLKKLAPIKVLENTVNATKNFLTTLQKTGHKLNDILDDLIMAVRNVKFSGKSLGRCIYFLFGLFLIIFLKNKI